MNMLNLIDYVFLQAVMNGGRIGSDMNDSVSLGSDSRPAITRSKPNKSPSTSTTTTATRTKTNGNGEKMSFLKSKAETSSNQSHLHRRTKDTGTPTDKSRIMTTTISGNGKPPASKASLLRTVSIGTVTSAASNASRPRSSSAPPLRRLTR